MDRPPFRGIVEGFFSAPLPIWSLEERLRTIKFVSSHCPWINSYFYCPKHDPQVAKDWENLYPEKEKQELAKFARECADRNITTVYGLNPVILDPASDLEQRETWMAALESKLEQVGALGFRNVCLLFDDVPMSYDAVEKVLSGEGAPERSFVELVNAAARRARGIFDNVWLCSPDYCFSCESPLTQALHDLDPEISLIWTGRGVFVRTVTSGDLQIAQSLLGAGRKLVLWHNYPVNDVEQDASVLNLGGFPQLDPELLPALQGVFSNPMRQCHANLPFYVTFSSYLGNPSSYDRSSAFEEAIETVCGTPNSDLFTLCHEFSACNFLDPEAKYFFGSLTDEPDVSRLIAGIERLIGGPAHLSMNEYGREFIRSIPFVFTEAQRFIKIARTLTNGGIVDRGWFNELDHFPTVPDVARNVKEVYDIVEARMEILPAVKESDLGILQRTSAVASGFLRQYPGKERLNITPGDEELYLATISELIAMEQSALLELLNSTPTPPLVRLKTYSLRQSINRFTEKRLRFAALTA